MTTLSKALKSHGVVMAVYTFWSIRGKIVSVLLYRSKKIHSNPLFENEHLCTFSKISLNLIPPKHHTGVKS